MLFRSKETEAKKKKGNKEEEEDNDRTVVQLIHRYNDLDELFDQLLNKGGYHPGVVFESGLINVLKLELNGNFYIIQNQQLIKSEVDGIITVSDEATYNNMNKAFVEFSHKILKHAHKSYYSAFDIEVINEYRSKAVVGNLKNEQK